MAIPSVQGSPAELSAIASRTEDRIRTLLDAELDRWQCVDPDLAAPLTALRDLVLAGGKRLRPAFCHWAFLGTGGDADDPRVVDAGAALELLHTFALVHDDIMDGSSTRRGMDAIHMRFVAEHGERRWRGEARRFGEGVAILVGDLAFVYADILLRGAPPDAMCVFDELRVEVNIGQYLDLVGTARGNPTVDQARRICRFKSGKYTVERPLHLGAALAGRLPEFEGPLSAYGLPLGEAFQLRDDLLGALGDGARIGKPVGDDLREGKPTSLVAHALAAAGPAERALLAGVGRADLPEDEVRALQAVLVDTGAVAATERDIHVLRDRAIAALDGAHLTPGAHTALVELAHFVSGRDH